MKCPVCKNGGVPYLEVAGHVYLRCPECTHQYLQLETDERHTQEVYGDTYFFGGGAGYTDYLSEGELILERGRGYARRASRLIQPGSLLDVGASAGFVMKAFQEHGWRVDGVEPNARMADHAEAATGGKVWRLPLEMVEEEGEYDLVTAIQVLGHFQDPRKAFEKLSLLVRSEGVLLVETWDCQSLTARLLKGGWHEYSPPSVLNCFSRQSLDHLAAQFGFQRVAGGLTFKKINAARAKSLIRSKRQDSWVNRAVSLGAELLPDSLNLFYPADDLFWAAYRREEKVETPSGEMAA